MFRKSIISEIPKNESCQNVTKRLFNLKLGYYICVFFNVKLNLDKNDNNKDLGFKFSELDLDIILNETSNLIEKPSEIIFGLTHQRKLKSQHVRLNYVSESPVSTSIPQAKYSKVKEITNNRQIIFPSKKLNTKSTSSILFKYIPLHTFDSFQQWNKYARKRPNINVFEIIEKGNNEPKIKQLKPSKFKQGFDIVPSYLNKKIKRYDIKDEVLNKEPIYDCKAVVKAFKTFSSSIKPTSNVCFIGPHKSGKSALVGSILLNKDVFDPAFVKKTKWEATKAAAVECQVSWLLDISLDERCAKETIKSSSYVIESQEKQFRLIDSPGNDVYFHETLTSLSVTDIVVLVLNHQSESLNTEYLHKFFKLLKGFSLSKLVVVFTNTMNSDCKSDTEYLLDISKRYGKWRPSIHTIVDLSHVQPKELASIEDGICQCEVTIDESKLQMPLIVEVTDIYKSVDSALPIVIGRVLCGGVAAGVNNTLSKVMAVPGSLHATVKSMKVSECGDYKTRSFAFAGDIVELTLPELSQEDSIKRGTILCHRQFPVSCYDHLRGKLLILRSGADHVPVINGSTVLVWTRTCSVFATITKIESVEMAQGRDNLTLKSPRLICDGARAATVRLVTEQMIPVQYSSADKLDVFLLFHNSDLFAAGRFVAED